MLHKYNILKDEVSVVENNEFSDYRIPEPNGPLQVLFAKPFGELFVAYFAIKQRGDNPLKMTNRKTISTAGTNAVIRLPIEDKAKSIEIAQRLRSDP